MTDYPNADTAECSQYWILTSEFKNLKTNIYTVYVSKAYVVFFLIQAHMESHSGKKPWHEIMMCTDSYSLPSRFHTCIGTEIICDYTVGTLEIETTSDDVIMHFAWLITGRLADAVFE